MSSSHPVSAARPTLIDEVAAADYLVAIEVVTIGWDFAVLVALPLRSRLIEAAAANKTLVEPSQTDGDRSRSCRLPANKQPTHLLLAIEP